MRTFLLPASTVALLCVSTAALLADEPAKPGTSAEVWRVLPAGKTPEDARLGKPRELRDKYHPWTPPETKDEWEREAQRIRERVLVSNGLWPMPPKTPLNAVIHGKIDRGDYTIEKVYFASHPGHYVTGNLYRPAKIEGKVPGVLCPHGHWANGRFYDAGDKGARQQIDQAAEKTMAGARYPLQARMVQLARMGCVVFHYDMVGYADSNEDGKQIPHRQGFTDADAGLRLQNVMGLQTWNSIRALDFLLSLPEVDAKRIGVTGASGGGTQTFMLCAVDPRPAVAFPAVMVSTDMQGGCVCENASYLRIGINNIALTALFAPSPLAMSGADDWTVAIESKGLPELRQVYSLYGKRDFVHAKAFPQFKHNYNRVARTMMYEWFNRHLDLGVKEPIVEQDFRPVPPDELSVWDDGKHHVPADAKDAAGLRENLTKTSERQFAELLQSARKDPAEYRRIVGTAAGVMLDPGSPDEKFVRTDEQKLSPGNATLTKGLLRREPGGETIPYAVLTPEKTNGAVVLWIDGQGKSHLFAEDGKPTAAVQKLLDRGTSVASIDVFLTGEFLGDGKAAESPKVHETYPGYTFGYNRPLLSNRVRDVTAALTALRRTDTFKTIHLVGTGEAGAWVLLARAVAGEQNLPERSGRLGRTIVDLGGFSFGKVNSADDPMFLPGALKYGGIGGLGALAAPGELVVAGTKGSLPQELKPLTSIYAAAKGRLVLDEDGLSPDNIAQRLLK